MRRKALRHMRRRVVRPAAVGVVAVDEAERLRLERNVTAIRGMIAYCERNGFAHENEDAMLAYAQGRLAQIGGAE